MILASGDSFIELRNNLEFKAELRYTRLQAMPGATDRSPTATVEAEKRERAYPMIFPRHAMASSLALLGSAPLSSLAEKLRSRMLERDR